MTELQMQPPFRIPTEEDYVTRAALVDKEFDARNGAWYSYHKEAVLDIPAKPTVRAFYANLSSVARLVEPISNDEHKPIDPSFAATHAFRAGMWTSGHVLRHVYNGKLKYEDALGALCNSVPFPAYSGKYEYETNGKYLMDLGELGLEKVGNETEGYIEKWGKEIVHEPTARQYYALGVGAVTFMHHQIYSTAYPVLQQNYEVSQLLHFDELEKYLASNPGSSSN
jgi:hypothetical protein